MGEDKNQEVEPMLSQKELQMIALLRQNARMSLTQMSKQTKTPISTLHERLKRADSYCIRKFTTLLDFQKLGFSTRVHIRVKSHKNKKEDLRGYLLKHHNVNALYKVNNGYDFLIDAVFRNLNEAENFLEKLEEVYRVSRKEAHYILEDISGETFLSNPAILPVFTAA